MTPGIVPGRFLFQRARGRTTMLGHEMPRYPTRKVEPAPLFAVHYAARK